MSLRGPLECKENRFFQSLDNGYCVYLYVHACVWVTTSPSSFYTPCLTKFNTFKLVCNDFLPSPGTGTRKLTFKEKIHTNRPGRHDCGHRIRHLCPQHHLLKGVFSPGQIPALWTNGSHRAIKEIATALRRRSWRHFVYVVAPPFRILVDILCLRLRSRSGCW